MKAMDLSAELNSIKIENYSDKILNNLQDLAKSVPIEFSLIHSQRLQALIEFLDFIEMDNNYE